jgi:hypothetical protein
MRDLSAGKSGLEILSQIVWECKFWSSERRLTLVDPFAIRTLRALHIVGIDYVRALIPQ